MPRHSDPPNLDCHPYCADQVERLNGDPELAILKVPMRALLWGVATSPEEFDALDGAGVVRIAKSDAVKQADGTEIPRIQLFFALRKGETPRLLYIHAPPYFTMPPL